MAIFDLLPIFTSHCDKKSKIAEYYRIARAALYSAVFCDFSIARARAREKCLKVKYLVDPKQTVLAQAMAI